MRFFSILFIGVIAAFWIYQYSDKSLKEATNIAQAAHTGSPLRSIVPQLKIFTADWCPPCKNMKKKVYSHPSMQKYREAYKWVMIDVDNNAQEAQRHNVTAVPTFIIVSTEGVELKRASGGMGLPEFVAFLDK